MTIRRAALIPTTAAVALGLAHDAAAATIATSRPCVNQRSAAQFVATGFTPGATVVVQMQGVPSVPGVAGPDGVAVVPFTAPTLTNPFLPPETYKLQASDGTNVATGTSLVAGPGVNLPATGPTRIQMRILLTGYEPGRVLYAHLRWGQKWRRTLKLGTAAGPCGVLDVKRKLLRKTAGPRGRTVYAQFDHNLKPAIATHQTAYARFAVKPAGARNFPENFILKAQGWRERTGL